MIYHERTLYIYYITLFPSPSPPPLPFFFPLNAYSLGKYFLAPILDSYQIQNGGLIRKCALARPNTPALQATHDVKVGCNTVKYTTAFLYSDWLYCLWQCINVFSEYV